MIKKYLAFLPLVAALLFSAAVVAQPTETEFSCANGEAVNIRTAAINQVFMSCVPAEPVVTPTVTATATSTVAPSPTATDLPTATATATMTPTATATATATATVAPSATPTTDPGGLFTWVSDFSDPAFFPAQPVSLYDMTQLTDWGLIIHSRDAQGSLQTFPAHHGPNCEAPLVTHDISAYRDALYACGRHIMTAAGDTNGGYNMAGFVPPVAVYFGANDTQVIEWRMSTNISSVRDWVDVSVIPLSSFTPYSLQRNFAPDMAGSSVGSMIAMLTATNEPPAQQFHWDFCQSESCVGASTSASMWEAFSDQSFEQRSRNRQLFRMTFENGSVRLESPELGITWFNPTAVADPDACANGCAVLFMHHVYNATKACVAGLLCDDTTWHWSDIVLTNAADMPVNRSVQANVWTRSGSAQMAMSAPSQGGEDMHCAVLGTNTTYSFDGVNFSSFELADVTQPFQVDNFSWRQVVVRNVPAGVSTIYFNGNSGWGELSVDTCMMLPDMP